MSDTYETLVAVDIGNSRIKLGRFDRASDCTLASRARVLPIAPHRLAEPTATLDLAFADRSADFDESQLATWCSDWVGDRAQWLVASVNRRGADRFEKVVRELTERNGNEWALDRLAFRDLPLAIEVDEPDRVGIDRLLAAVAANRVRSHDRPAIIVDSGSATTIDLVSVAGAFCGGAILPGIAMAARALDEQTDALPFVAVNQNEPPQALGKSTIAAIESGLFWGAVGAIREVVWQLAVDLETAPEVLVTGGASPRIARLLAEREAWNVRHVPHLVLAGIAVVDGTRR